LGDDIRIVHDTIPCPPIIHIIAVITGLLPDTNLACARRGRVNGESCNDKVCFSLDLEEVSIGAVSALKCGLERVAATISAGRCNLNSRIGRCGIGCGWARCSWARCGWA